MGIYTINEDVAADQAVEDVLDVVVKEIVGLLGKDIRAIVLIGGYGRGEGGVLKTEGGYRLVNDFDIIVFVHNNVRKMEHKYKNALRKLVKEIEPRTNGLKQIDIDITNTQRFRFIPNKVSYYEVKHGHKVLYGDIDLDAIMPEFKTENLPIFDGTMYFYTRGSGLLIPSVYFIKGELGKKANRENFQIELQKACVAMGDALLLMAGEYHFSYQERLKRFRLLNTKDSIVPSHLMSKIPPFYEWGVEGKLSPSFVWEEGLTAQDMVSKWCNVREVFGEFFLWFESKRMKISFENWMEYSKYIFKHGIREPFYVKLREICKKCIKAEKMVLKTKCACLLPVMPLLLFGLEREDGSCKKVFLDNAWTFLGLTGEKKKTWLLAVREYLSRFHPDGVVEKVLKMSGEP